MTKKRVPPLGPPDDGLGDEARLILDELGAISGSTGPANYRRAQLVAKVLTIPEFMTSYLDDKDKALANIQERYFQDIGGLMPLQLLVAIYHHFPEEKDWESRRYNLKVLQMDYEEQTRLAKNEAFKITRRRVTQADVDELKEQVKDKEFQLTRVVRESTKQSEQLAELRDSYNSLVAENERLRLENAELKGRVAALEALIGSR